MKKVITYGTYDLLHFGHVRLLERAKALGDYLIVGITADDFDKSRGKINVQQSLMERVEAIRATGIADKIIIEEYEGQKIDDIRRYGVDIFTVGSDWTGKFDYLKEYCDVVYLDRTEGISSSELRSQNNSIKLGIIGENALLSKYLRESYYVNGIHITALYCRSKIYEEEFRKANVKICNDLDELLDSCDAVYIDSVPEKHEEQIRRALSKNKHVLCESPITTDPNTTKELFEIAGEKNLILMEAIKTAFSTAYSRLMLLIKSGKIGQVISIDSVCTSLQKKIPKNGKKEQLWSGFEAWMPTALLPIFQILGIHNCMEHFVTSYYDNEKHFDKFTQINIVYPDAVATAKIGVGMKSEGNLVISGTKGYIYVPSPWWKTDYFEIRYENQKDNKRYFYQLEGEGIRYALVTFSQVIRKPIDYRYIDKRISEKIADTFKKYKDRENLTEINW